MSLSKFVYVYVRLEVVLFVFGMGLTVKLVKLTD